MNPVQTREVRPSAAPSETTVLSALSVAVLLIIAAWALVDPRQLQDTPVWAKPMKFAVSFVVFFITLALVEARLSQEWRNGLLLRITTGVMATAMILEMSYMTIMAAQQQASHFNLATPFARLMYSLMGVGAVALVVGAAIFGVAVLRDAGARLGPGLRWGVGWGFILSCVLTLVTAGYMSATGSHVGVAPPGGRTLPLMGWSGSVGDIRPAHFLALHAMQVLPMVGLLFDRAGIEVRNMRWVALAYAVLTTAVFLQALAGFPLIRL